VVGQAAGRRRGYGASSLDGVEDEGLIGAEMGKPGARNDGRAGALVAVCWTAAFGRHPLRARDLRRQPWPDHDPSRVAVEHGSGDFVRHAWHGHAELPDSVAGLPSAGRGALLARRFRRSRSGLDRTADRQEPGSGSARTGTSCKTLHPGTRDRMRFVSKAQTRSSPARFGAPALRALLFARSC
jgi:hypothetical protein